MRLSSLSAWLVIVVGGLVLALLPPLPAAAQGAERPRLALVVAVGTVGGREVLESAKPDARAVAAALRAGGFEVLLREDPNTAELRAALAEFKGRLKPASIGLVYYTGLAGQVDGRNLLIPADVALADTLTGAAVGALLRAVGLPLQEAADALQGPPDAPRALIVDAAYRHPVLARLTPPGLARLRVAPGTMGLLGHAPAALQDVLATAPPTRFAKVVVEALTTSRISMPEALQAVRLSVLDISGGRTQPWLGGETAGREFLADPQRLERPASAAPAAAPPVPAVVAAPAPAASAPAVVATVARPPPPPAAPASAASAPGRVTDGRTARAPGQGERPVVQGKANAWGHAEGDTLSYEVTDTRKDELLLSYTLAIETVAADGTLQANGGTWLLDPQGRVMLQRAEDGAQSRFEPVQDWWWQKPQPGESRAVAFVETYVLADKSRGRTEWRGTAQVGTARLLETGAGDYQVLPIRTTGRYTRTPEGGGAVVQGPFIRTVWFAPKLGLPVAIEIEDNDDAGRPVKRERVELTHAQTTRSAN
jgi:hypothetical protein